MLSRGAFRIFAHTRAQEPEPEIPPASPPEVIPGEEPLGIPDEVPVEVPADQPVEIPTSVPPEFSSSAKYRSIPAVNRHPQAAAAGQAA